MTKAVLPLCLALSLIACDGEKKAAPAAGADAKAADSKTGEDKKPADAKAAAPQAHGGGTPANPHGAPGAAPGAAPHGGAPGNPHAGMKAGAPAPNKLGPPREVTPSGDVVAETLAEFEVSVPKEWEKGKPSGMMRMAQWVVPGPGGDAELVVYRFKGGAGGVEANMDRWKKQFTPPEGKSIDDLAKQDKKTAGTLTMHTLDVTGHYVAAMTPGADEKHDKPDHRMLAVIIEGSGDPLFLKATGPTKTLDVWAEAWGTVLDSVKVSG